MLAFLSDPALPTAARERAVSLLRSVVVIATEGIEAIGSPTADMHTVFEFGVELGQLAAALVEVVLGAAGTRAGLALREERIRIRGANRDAAREELLEASAAELPEAFQRNGATWVAVLVSDDGAVGETICLPATVLLRGGAFARNRAEVLIAIARKEMGKAGHPSTREPSQVPPTLPGSDVERAR